VHDRSLAWDETTGTRVVAVSQSPIRVWIVGSICTIVWILAKIGDYLE